MLKEFSIRTNQQVEFVKLTGQIQKLLDESGVQEGICHVYVPHTTAGITINEGADPDVIRDMTMELNKIVPFEDGYRHAEGNSAAHIKASMMGPSVAVMIEHVQIGFGNLAGDFLLRIRRPEDAAGFSSF